MRVFVSLMGAANSSHEDDTLALRNTRNLMWHALVLARFPKLQREFGGRASLILSKPWRSEALVDMPRSTAGSTTDLEEFVVASDDSMPLLMNNDNNND